MGPSYMLGVFPKSQQQERGCWQAGRLRFCMFPGKEELGVAVPASFQLVFTAVFFDLFLTWGFPGGALVKNLPANVGHARERGSIPGSGSPGERNGNRSSVFAGASHGQKSPAGYSPWSCKELDITE